MKHTLSTLTVLFILLTSSMSWGSVDGKGLFCNLDEEKSDNFVKGDDKIGFFFESGDVVTIVTFTQKNDKIRSEVLSNHPFHTDLERILWKDRLFSYELNRSNLELKLINGLSFKQIYQCDLIVGGDAFRKRLGVEKKNLQSKYDEKLKDKKI